MLSMEYIKINGLALEYRNEKLLQITNLSVNEGQKIGLIGENGAGKTTLFKVINQEQTIFSVTGQIRRNCPIVMVPQVLSYNEQSGGENEKEVIKSAFNKATHKKNGLLLLDEPTSNLDIDQQEWLMKLINSVHNPMIIISHDQNLLENTVNTVWLLNDRKVSEYKGTFKEFETTLKKQEQKKINEYEEQQKRIAKLKVAQRRKETKAFHADKPKRGESRSERKTRDYGGKERKLLRTSKALKKRIEVSTARINKPQVRHPITLKNIKHTGIQIEKNSSLFRIEPQKVIISEKELFSISQEIKIKSGQKIALIGPNGSGKSVFLNQLVHHRINEWVNPKVKIGFFTQNLTNDINKSVTLQAEINENSIFNREDSLKLLSDLHLRHLLTSKICDLSGGQLICFKLARALLGEHNLLVLDEPTNFLDLPSIKAVEEFLINYPFSVIIVSHDQNFLKALDFPTWRIDNQKLVLASSKNRQLGLQEDSELSLLKYKLAQSIADPSVTIAELQEIKQKITKLSGQGQ